MEIFTHLSVINKTRKKTDKDRRSEHFQSPHLNDTYPTTAECTHSEVYVRY